MNIFQVHDACKGQKSLSSDSDVVCRISAQFFVHSRRENELPECLAACQETEQTVEFWLTDAHIASRPVRIENMRPLAVTVADLGF